jgi:hypothetical protein
MAMGEPFTLSAIPPDITGERLVHWLYAAADREPAGSEARADFLREAAALRGKLGKAEVKREKAASRRAAVREAIDRATRARGGARG